MNKTIILATVLALGGLAAAGDGKDAKTPAKAMEMPKAPKEVADMAKAMAGTWTCTGKGMMDGSSIDMTGKLTTKMDLDGFWYHETLDGKMGKMGFKFESYATFDTGTRKWRKVSVDNMGGQSVGTSDGMTAGKLDWAIDSMGPMGAMMDKEHIDTSDAKAGTKVWGETSMDKGKTWKKTFEVACKK